MMMTAMVSSELVGTALSWMLTYLIHSTILILAVWLLCRGIKPLAAKISPSAENLGWKLALVGAFVTATVQIAVGVRPALGAFEFESGPKVVEQVEREQPRVMVIPAGQPVIVDEREAMMLGAGPGSLSSADPAAPEPEPAPLWPKLVLLARAIAQSSHSSSADSCMPRRARRLSGWKKQSASITAANANQKGSRRSRWASSWASTERIAAGGSSVTARSGTTISRRHRAIGLAMRVDWVSSILRLISASRQSVKKDSSTGSSSTGPRSFKRRRSDQAQAISR